MNKIYSHFYSNFVKLSYKNVSEVKDKEEVYYRGNKLVVLVKDKEIGERIYDIVKSLKDRKTTFSTYNITLKLTKYVADRHKRVKLFCIDVNLDGLFDYTSKVGKLQELVSLVSDMKQKGYFLDNSKFECEKCNCISSFLSFFEIGNESTNVSDESLIKYIHYVLSDGGNLEEFYQKIVNDNAICSMSEFPYTLPVIRMCYNYYVTGYVPWNIYDILQSERLEKYSYSDYLIANEDSFKSHYAVVEANDEYTIYDTDIKIYHTVSPEFAEFLKTYTNKWNNQILETIHNIIIDFNGKVIGYKFSASSIEEEYSIFDMKFRNQRTIIDFVTDITYYLFKVHSQLYVDNVSSEFNVEKSITFMGNIWEFRIRTIKELFELVTSDKNLLVTQIMIIFFKLLLLYLNTKYGEMHEEEQFLEKLEVKCLNPVVAKAFIHYTLGQKSYDELAAGEFYKFISETKALADDYGYFFYDLRLGYSPLFRPYLFKKEAEKKYNIQIQKGMEQILPDGRRLITFNKSKSLSKLKDFEVSLREDISKKFGNLGTKVEIVEISEIIYSEKLNDDNMYYVVGYVTDPIRGERLTEEKLLGLSNKDFLKVAAYLFSKFGKYYIAWNAIRMDEYFNFYIDIFDKDFQIIKSTHSNSNESFVSNAVRYLIKKGYNPNAFIDVNFSVTGYDLKDHLLKLANSLDTYCDEHGIYYDGSKGACPVCLKTKYVVPQDFEKSANKIFEDLYATHYRLDNRYNLKVYKASCVNTVEAEDKLNKTLGSLLDSKESQTAQEEYIDDKFEQTDKELDEFEQMDKKLDEILGSILGLEESRESKSSKALKMGQDCFVPCKKAICDGKFIGYIYDAVQLDNNEPDVNVCNDIKDPQKLKNRPRLMSLIRLILQIKEITESGLGFVKNPFSYVFLSKTHKKQVQILNIDFLSEKGSVKNTKKWTCQYVCETLASDPSLEVDISDCSNDLDAVLKKLQNLSEDMTKYCSIHKMYYKKDYLFCPKCLNNDQVERLEVEKVKKAKITNRKEDNEGGEARIYYEDDSVIKVFKDEINYNQKVIVIAHVLAKKERLEEINNQNLKYKYIIPQKLLVDKESSEVFGYRMKKVSDGIPISTLRDKVEVEKLGLTVKDVLELLITVGKGIETLHANNIYIGDLNGRNILFDTHKNVYFLDFDGMGVDDIAPEFCTDGYIDPVSKKNENITMKDDWYSFAVQAFYYLTFTHPFNGIYSIIEDGKQKKLEIPDKMERRISLLGGHGIKPPAITESWDWMDEELKSAFLLTFESDNRESIVPYIVSQYEKLYSGDKPYNKSIRINPKFVATEIISFGRDVVRIINHYTAVRNKDNSCHIIIHGQKGNYDIYPVQNQESINNVLLSKDETLAFFIGKEKVIVIDLRTNTQLCSKEISDWRDVVVNGSTLYYTGISEEKHVIFQLDVMSNGDIEEQKIKFPTNQEMKRLCVKFNSKFVLVMRALQNSVDEIYCNSEKLCDISYRSENSEYTIIYDNATNSWLVVNSEGNGIIIKANGKYKQLNIEKSINDVNIRNITFNKGKIYIPNNDCLHIVNTNDQITTKKMECNRIMTPNSKLYDLGANGFSVANEQMLYEVRRV